MDVIPVRSRIFARENPNFEIRGTMNLLRCRVLVRQKAESLRNDETNFQKSEMMPLVSQSP